MAPSDSNEICDWGPVFEQHQRWLYRIALRKIVNHHRASGRRRKLLQSAFELEASVRAEDSMTPFSWLLKTEAQTSVQQGLEKLQRIVDGELSHSRRAEQLKSLEPHSLQWRELALLLLEPLVL
jgi:DNA-directed RNA polymerase specialized sigma24 family protein